MELYIKRPASEPPQNGGIYPTNLGELTFEVETEISGFLWRNKDCAEAYPSYYLDTAHTDYVTFEQAMFEVIDRDDTDATEDPQLVIKELEELFQKLSAAPWKGLNRTDALFKAAIMGAKLFHERNTADLVKECDRWERTAHMRQAELDVMTRKLEEVQGVMLQMDNAMADINYTTFASAVLEALITKTETFLLDGEPINEAELQIQSNCELASRYAHTMIQLRADQLQRGK